MVCASDSAEYRQQNVHLSHQPGRCGRGQAAASNPIGKDAACLPGHLRVGGLYAFTASLGTERLFTRWATSPSRL